MADDVGPDLALEGFRAEAAAWLNENFPASLRAKPIDAAELFEGGPSTGGDPELWRKRIGEKGWTTPTWPKQYGGGGLSNAQARVLQQEMAKIGAYNPAVAGMGITMIGPTIMDYGTEEGQKQRHIPPITSRARCAGAWAIPSPAPALTSPR